MNLILGIPVAATAPQETTKGVAPVKAFEVRFLSLVDNCLRFDQSNGLLYSPTAAGS